MQRRRFLWPFNNKNDQDPKDQNTIERLWHQVQHKTNKFSRRTFFKLVKVVGSWTLALSLLSGAWFIGGVYAQKEWDVWGRGVQAVRKFFAGDWLRKQSQEHAVAQDNERLAIEQTIIFHPDIVKTPSNKIGAFFDSRSSLQRGFLSLRSQNDYDPDHDVPPEKFKALGPTGLTSNRDAQIFYCFKPPQKLPNGKLAPVLIFSGGQVGDIGAAFEFAERSGIDQTALGYLFYEYTGYGQSSGIPSEQSCYASLNAVSKYLNDEKNINYRDQILVGPSLGGAISTEIATRRPYRGLLLISTFTNAADIFEHFRQSNGLKDTDPKPGHILQSLNTIAKIPNVQCKILLAHGKPDTYIPFWQGERLFNAAQKANKLSDDRTEIFDINLQHEDLLQASKELFLQGLLDFAPEALPIDKIQAH